MSNHSARPKRHSFWQISTGTILGALIMTVASSLLGAQAPWFVERLTVGRRGDVSFTVNSVFSGAPAGSDRARWHLDEEAGFAVAKPPQDWLINKTNPARPLAGPSIATVPFYHFSTSQLSPLANLDKIRQDDIVTTEIRPNGAPHKLEFNDLSDIDSVPLKFNPISSPDFMKRIITMELRVSGALSPDELSSEVLDVLEQRTPEGKEEYSKLRTQVEAQFDKVINANWPTPLQYSDNVTVTSMKISLFRGDPIFEAVLRGRGLNLFTASGLVSLANPELMSVNTKRASISTNNMAMLLDTSLELRKFSLDGKLRDSCELRRYVLLVLADQNVFVVVWRNLVGLGSTGADADRMRDLFQSFRLLRAVSS
jgi:hypothetical protein